MIMNQLIKELVAENAISSDTIITACHIIKDLNGRFINKSDEFRFINCNKKNVLTLQRLSDKSVFDIQTKNITLINGMSITRYIDIFNLNFDGSYKKIGKKRGKKTNASKLI